MRSMLVGISALVLMGSTSANAAVSLVGTDVTLNYLFPSVTQVFGTTVLPITTDPTTLDCPAFGSGVCSAFAESAAITIGADSFTVVENSGSSYTTASFNGVEFSNLDFGPGEKITGFSLLTNLPGLTPADISFTSDSIRYDASGLSFQNSPYFVTLTVTTAVPELSTYVLMLLGFAGLGFAGYRKSRNRVALAV
ncbi:MAG: hypothetical protein JO051_00790 [Acidobacteriaceae bacterium]|jgi:hypothetical protein|nr:hypothetical protein [Acidobacteriaceae bacterium]